jgi:hypothetical protein
MMPIIRSRRQTVHHHTRSELPPARGPRHRQACRRLTTVRTAMSEYEEHAGTIDLRSHADLGTSHIPARNRQACPDNGIMQFEPAVRHEAQARANASATSSCAVSWSPTMIRTVRRQSSLDPP